MTDFTTLLGPERIPTGRRDPVTRASINVVANGLLITINHGEKFVAYDLDDALKLLRGMAWAQPADFLRKAWTPTSDESGPASGADGE